MVEQLDTSGISEIGKEQLGSLIRVLETREGSGYNAVGWGGTSSELKAQTESRSLYPASSFAVVAEGISRYKRQPGSSLIEDTDSMRELSQMLVAGSEVFKKVSEIDSATVLDQIKRFVESNGGIFDVNTDWPEFIRERAERITQKANAIDDVNR